MRAVGGGSLILACLSRYEAWPIAATCAAFCVWDAIKQRRGVYLGCAALALAGPALWLTLSHVSHGDAWFFVGRVTAYRRALGGSEAMLWQRVAEYPWALVWNALGLFILFPIFLFMAPKTRQPDGPRYARCAVALFALLAFLTLGNVRDCVPTHHEARVLLPLWFLGASSPGANLLDARRTRPAAGGYSSWSRQSRPFRWSRACICRATRASLSARSNWRLATLRAKRPSLAWPSTTADYGYFAVQARLRIAGRNQCARRSRPASSEAREREPVRLHRGPGTSAACAECALRRADHGACSAARAAV